LGSEQRASHLLTLRDLVVSPASMALHEGVEYGLAGADGRRSLVILAPRDAGRAAAFEGERGEIEDKILLRGPLSPRNADALRAQLPWLRPHPLGLRTSAGFGDRLGLATPGHVRAVRAAGGDVAPIFAQQSIREMERTGRSPQQVMDDAMWGVFAEGWRDGFGADADHLKITEDIDRCVAAGYTFFTFDPGAHVDDTVAASPSAVRAAVDNLPWDALEDSPAALVDRYAGRCYDLEGRTIALDEGTLLRAAVKYGRAVAHVAALYRHLQTAAGDRDREVEISVDETENPTTHAEHVYIASELQRLGVRWVSLAPRYSGRFEKGVDYIGDLAAFEADLAVHAAIARRFGPYKLSLHSGSDKFAVYEPAVRQTRGLVHLKTAGTSYLEALRVVAAYDPALLREIYAFARERYHDDRASYHVSATLERAPAPGDLADAALPALLDQFDARQILHVTFGSVLTARGPDGRPRFYDRLIDVLRGHAEAYAAGLQAHFLRHLASFAAAPRVAKATEAAMKARGNGR
jgi:tagaturonate epimerase